ncbi:MAG: hypothetical protein ACUVXA_06540 [Candidatus Jordarchaeum sp.]
MYFAYKFPRKEAFLSPETSGINNHIVNEKHMNKLVERVVHMF